MNIDNLNFDKVVDELASNVHDPLDELDGEHFIPLEDFITNKKYEDYVESLLQKEITKEVWDEEV